MEPFVKLDNNNRGEAIAFLEKDPSHSMIMYYDIINVGMDPGDTCIHGHYFGRWGDLGLVALAAYYGLGSMFIWAEKVEFLQGFGKYMVETGIVPAIIGGETSQIEYVMNETAGSIKTSQVISLFLMSATEINTVPSRELVELADKSMLDELVAIAGDFEVENFGEAGTSDEDNRFLHCRHVEDKASLIIKRGGHIVSKADGLRVDGAGGQVLRVYTAPYHRSKGYAAACVGELSRNMLDGGQAVYLEVKSDNRPAIRAYEKVGFRKVAERKFVVIAETA